MKLNTNYFNIIWPKFIHILILHEVLHRLYGWPSKTFNFNSKRTIVYAFVAIDLKSLRKIGSCRPEIGIHHPN